MRTSPMISDAQMADLFIARSSPFDIDQDDPIDLEPRYFLPGPVKAMERALGKTPLDWPNFIRQFLPIEHHRRSRDQGLWHAIKAVGDASHMARQFVFTAMTTTAWNRW